MLSYRRILLDRDLEESKGYMKGITLDVGGGRKRGKFIAPDEATWIVLDSSRERRPQLLADAQNMPVRPEAIDCVKCTELLEHVKHPEEVLDEISRVLKPGGTLILSIPFNSHIHDDPYDFQRFTDQKLTGLLEDNFHILSLKKQGLYFTVLADMIKQGIAHSKRVWHLCLRRLLPALELMVKLEKLNSVQNSKFMGSFTTGFFIVAVRK
jgi:ubiquinone/menaquinone biosynthesis C-methylase UbiE